MRTTERSSKIGELVAKTVGNADSGLQNHTQGSRIRNACRPARMKKDASIA